MSGRHGRFEKQDQRPLHENWMTGFDNKDQLEALAAQLASLRKSVEQWKTRSEEHRRRLAELDSQLTVIGQLVNIEFSTIDLPGAEAGLARSQERLAALLDPDSDTSQAKAAYDHERRIRDSIRNRISESEKAMAVLDEKRSHADEERQQAAQRIGPGLSDDERALAEKRLPIASDIEAKQLDPSERKEADAVDQKLNRQHEHGAEQEKRLVRLMEAARREDKGALAETGSDLQDIPDYLDRLRLLNEEALPAKLSRFLEYLNQSSDQGVTQLLAGIAEEVDGIEHRIAELNQTLVRVDFRSGRYLQLQPQRIKHERLRSLETFLGALTEGDHWLLVMDLDGSLLPFRKQRVRSSELRDTALPGKRLLIVENEGCQHQLPELPETIAVLGAGFDLAWTDGLWLREKQVGYWGDIDTWGLKYLANARQTLRKTDALMMTSDIYDRHFNAAVPEPVTAGTDLPAGLSNVERVLYERLLTASRGRLEQEFLPETTVREALLTWCHRECSTKPLDN